MPALHLASADLRFTIDPDLLEFSDTSELVQYPLSWIGQERAETATRFGLEMNQPGYNLFVLGEVGSGRSSLLRQAMATAATNKAIPPDLCYLHNFDAPEKPQALYLPAGQGRLLRQGLECMIKSLQSQIPQRLDEVDFKAESERIEKVYKEAETKAYAELCASAEARNFAIRREAGRLAFMLLDKKGQALVESEILALSKERRAEIEQAEQELRTELARYFEKIRPLESAMNEALVILQRKIVKPLLDCAREKVRRGLEQHFNDATRLDTYLNRVGQNILDNLERFKIDSTNNDNGQAELAQTISHYQVNLVVDNSALSGAPVIVDDNPLFRSLFGNIEYQSVNDVLVTDFTRIRAGSLLRAHGGFLMLYLHDLLADGFVWEKLRRFLRSGRLQIEEPNTIMTPIPTVSLEPEAVDLHIKIVLIGSREQYYTLQEEDPELARRFRIKVDFAESFAATNETRRASSVFIAHACEKLGLPHFSVAAVARLLEHSHRETSDQARQSAIFAHTEALIMESAEFCRMRRGCLVEVSDIEAAFEARVLRHDYPEQCMQESIAAGDVLISVEGEAIGHLNALTQIDLGDYRFGLPVRVTARTYAGEDGLLNIEREVEMSGPIHDKGVFILQNYLAALFAQHTPLSFNAAIVFEQEYHGIEGDSASCAEFFVLLSSLSGLPLKQGIAVTGAMNQHGEILPVGGVNEKITGYFRTCETAGLDGNQGVLIPYSNRRNLMLDHKILAAVAKGLFHIYTARHVLEGIELLTGCPAGVMDISGNYANDSVLGHAQATLLDYRHACHPSEQYKNEPK
ncbi:Predicted ATP-dependent protease [Nitrosomonas cryotolerans]|uniref:Predicted ATP-dependent protease n=1 Tax=Nitrosomonas cryotolerans ATCC 49181 TaxID=1131553 RepID=A0A1N6IZ92_9PROT|nr:ATP-binding protein [Nitrosomonas cryotolerans]SFP54673.1 Predicted ATP-dependent protease [Nitrosomonas cryotolerans]SIO37404.1 Predicted ATP-dependent protease [Nitrosomonas cryotolerans ATCC 49181]